VQKFTDLKVWQRGHALALEVYRLTKKFPAEERFGLTSQLRRAVVSVPTNIAEGSKRLRTTEYSRFLNMAEASLAEVQYLVLLSRDLGYVPESASQRLFDDSAQLARMLHALRGKVDRA
jgi:four helix bundle protein